MAAEAEVGSQSFFTSRRIAERRELKPRSWWYVILLYMYTSGWVFGGLAHVARVPVCKGVQAQ
jgi:hypothetical protein